MRAQGRNKWFKDDRMQEIFNPKVGEVTSTPNFTNTAKNFQKKLRKPRNNFFKSKKLPLKKISRHKSKSKFKKYKKSTLHKHSYSSYKHGGHHSHRIYKNQSQQIEFYQKK